MGSRLTLQERLNYILFTSLIALLSATHIFIFAKDKSIFLNGEIGSGYGIAALIATMVVSGVVVAFSVVVWVKKFNLMTFGKIARYGSMVIVPFLLVAIFMALSYGWTEDNPFKWQVSDAFIVFGSLTTLLLSFNLNNFQEKK